MVPLRYQNTVCRVVAFVSTKSGLLSPLKSFASAKLQPTGSVGPNAPRANVVLFRNHIAVCRVLELKECVSPGVHRRPYP